MNHTKYILEQPQTAQRDLKHFMKYGIRNHEFVRNSNRNKLQLQIAFPFRLNTCITKSKQLSLSKFDTLPKSEKLMNMIAAARKHPSPAESP